MLESSERNISSKENNNQKTADEGSKHNNIEAKKENKEQSQVIISSKRKTSEDIFKDETTALLSEKKLAIETKFENLKKEYELSNKESIYDLIEYVREKKANTKEAKEENKEKIESIMNTIEENLKFLKEKTKMIYAFGFIYFIFYLVGIFQLLDLIDACKKQMGIIFNSFFFKKKRESDETFIELYVNSCFKNLPEFDFTFFTSILGGIPLNCCGFFISSITFTIANSALFFVFMKLDFDKEKYDFFDFFYILIFFLIFFIFFGMVSLFAHEKFYDGIINFEKTKEKLKNNIKVLKEKLKEINNNEGNKEKEKQEGNKKEFNEREEEQDINQIFHPNYEKTEQDLNENNKKNNYEQKMDKNNDNKVDESKGDTNRKTSSFKKEKKYFYFLCVGIALAYIINKVINLVIHSSLSYRTYENYFLLIFLLIYLISFVICLLFYLLFRVSLKHIYMELEINNDDDKEESNNSKTQKFWKIFGFLLYYEKVILNNDEQNNVKNIENNTLIKKEECPIKNKQTINKNILTLNKSLKDINKNENITKNKNEDKEVKQNEDVNPDNKEVDDKIKDDNKNGNNQNFSCGNLILFEICPCVEDCKKSNKNSKYVCASCKLGCRKCYHKSKDTEFGDIISCCCKCCKCDKCCCYCCECCNCCECCPEVTLKESYEEEKIFCYAYKVQRKCSWFCDLIFKNNVISLIAHNIFVEIGIIGFEKRINENLESNDHLYYLYIIISYFVIFLLFTIIYTKFLFSHLKGKNFAGYTFFSFIFYFLDMIIAALSVSKKNISLKNFVNKWVIILPLSYTKYINFIVTDQFISILDEDNIDILSNSFIFTCFFIIYDMIVFIISDIIDLSVDTLTFVQLILITSIFLFTYFYLFLCNPSKYLFCH